MLTLGHAAAGIDARIGVGACSAFANHGEAIDTVAAQNALQSESKRLRSGVVQKRPGHPPITHSLRISPDCGQRPQRQGAARRPAAARGH
jgi:hypothetical protein